MSDGTPANTTPATEHVVTGGTIANPDPVVQPTPTTVTAQTTATVGVAATWPENWRQQMAGEDERELKQIGRYGTPAEVWRKTRQLETKLSSGTLKPVLADDASAEDIADYRRAHGIPETPDKYDFKDIKLDGVEGIAQEIAKVAHDKNMTPAQAKAIVSLVPELNRKAAELRSTQDLHAQTETEEALRAEWGPDYRRHINLIHGLLDSSVGPDVKAKFLGGRLADGTPIGSSPEALKMFLGLALVKNPTGVVVPSVNGDPAKGLEEAIGDIEKTMRTDRKRYNGDEKMQARYRQLLEARLQLQQRA